MECGVLVELWSSFPLYPLSCFVLRVCVSFVSPRSQLVLSHSSLVSALCAARGRHFAHSSRFAVGFAKADCRLPDASLAAEKVAELTNDCWLIYDQSMIYADC